MTSQIDLEDYSRVGSSPLVVELQDGSHVRIEAVPSLSLGDYFEMSNVARLSRVFDDASDNFSDLILYEREAEEGEDRESVGYLFWVAADQYRISFYGEYDKDDRATALLVNGLQHVLQGRVFMISVDDSSGGYEDELTVYEASHIDAFWEVLSLGLHVGEVVEVLEGEHLAELEDVEREDMDGEDDETDSHNANTRED